MQGKEDKKKKKKVKERVKEEKEQVARDTQSRGRIHQILPLPVVIISIPLGIPAIIYIMKIGRCLHYPRRNIQSTQPLPYYCVYFCPEPNRRGRRFPGFVTFMESLNSSLNSFSKATQCLPQPPPNRSRKPTGKQTVTQKGNIQVKCFP